MRYVAAHKPALITGKLKAGRIQKIKFEITDSAEAVLTSSEEITLVDGKGEWNWTPNNADDSVKILADTEDFIKVGVRIFWFSPDESGSGGYEYLDDVTVFRDEIKIKVLDAEDKPVDKASVRIVVVRPGLAQNQKIQALPADATGEVTFKELLRWNSIQVTVGGAWALKNAENPWKATKDKGLSREIVVVAKKYKAEMRGIAREGAKYFFPIAELGETRIQFVNFNADQSVPYVGGDDNPDDHYGHRVRIRVGAENDYHGEFENDPIFVMFEAGATNSKRNDPKPGLIGANAEGILELRLNHRGEAECEVELGYAGGDTFTLKVCSVKDFSGTVDQTLKFINWRKLYYELGFPESMIPALAAAELPDGAGPGPHRDLPANVREWLQKILDPIFVEYKLRKSFSFRNNQAPHGALQFRPAAFYGAADHRDFYLASFYSSSASALKFTSDSHTVRMYLVDVYYQDTPHEVVGELTLTTAEQKIGPTAPWRHFLPNVEAVLRKGKHPATLPACTWEAVVPASTSSGHPGLDARGAPLKGTLPPTCFHVDAFNVMRITLPSEAAALVGAQSATKCPIRVRYFIYEVQIMRGGTKGGLAATADSYGKTGVSQVITLRSRVDIDASLIGHELGHAMNMTMWVRSQIPPGLPIQQGVDDGGVYYRSPKSGERVGARDLRSPGEGAHCATGLADKTPAMYPSDPPAGGCIMYGTGPSIASTPGTEPILFRSVCLEYAKAQDLSRLY